MDFKKPLSWKLLLSLALASLVIAVLLSDPSDPDNTLSGAFGLFGIILLAMGIVDTIRQARARRSQKT